MVYVVLGLVYPVVCWCWCPARVEAGSNTSTVALRVVEGDENGTQCLGV
jgi:hypothetical protein